MSPSFWSFGAITPESSITAIVCFSGPENAAIRAGAAIIATISRGISIVVIMKLLRFTRSRYSRDMIIPSALFIRQEVFEVVNWNPRRCG